MNILMIIGIVILCLNVLRFGIGNIAIVKSAITQKPLPILGKPVHWILGVLNTLEVIVLFVTLGILIVSYFQT